MEKMGVITSRGRAELFELPSSGLDDLADSLDYIGQWTTIRCDDGYGITYKVGYKQNHVDAEGDPAMGIVFFAVPSADTGLPLTSEIAERLYGKLRSVAQTTAVGFSERVGNTVVGVRAPTPEMMEELSKIDGMRIFADYAK